jgi:uncharacterized protein YuzE
MKKIDYDSETDAITLEVSHKKVHQTIELTEHILVDMTENGAIVGLEILDASSEISKIFNRVVPKSEITKLLCQIKQEPNNEYLIQFSSPERNQMANLLFPVYKSPLIS